MALRRPTEADIRELGERLHLDLTDDEVRDYRDLVADSLEDYEFVRRRAGADHDHTVSRVRDPGHRVRDGDPYNAWITRCEVADPTADGGPLSGWEVAVKDNVAVAGVEMTCGSRVMEGYVPGVDATVVSRLLDAGATVIGKTNMDDMAFAGNGHSSAFGPTLNPRDDDHLAGGSSGGSAIAVATGEADAAIGSDQGGSVRAPAAWTGVVGHKPTHGLVPYTGCVGIENTIDHAGPLAPDVETAARALSVVAGTDPDDPRQPPTVPEEAYESGLEDGVDGISIAVVEEGFDRPGSEEQVNQSVRDALSALDSRGATVEEVSIPMHADARRISSVTIGEGFLAAVAGEGLGHNRTGWYDTGWVDAFGSARRARGSQFPPGVKLTLLRGAYARERFHSRYYARAMNLRAELEKRYDQVLSSFDLLAMPTTPQTAHEYVPDQDREAFIADSWANLANTGPFNLTGHPSLSVPVAPADGLPAGLMLTGRHFEDATVLAAGRAVERALGTGADLYG